MIAVKGILLTGGTGFVGKAIAEAIQCRHEYRLQLALRRKMLHAMGSVSCVEVGSIGATTDWSLALADISVVIHSAARVHVMHDTASEPLAKFREVNVDGTLTLARQAADAGVKRFIFISSIKVNGEGTLRGNPYTAFDTPAPEDPYGISKMEAEQGLRLIADETGMEVVIIRPVLVYGPGVKANFLSMMRWVHKGIPLPLGAINNSRSLVSLDNLVDLIVTCIDHPAAANQTFLVSDGEDLSTTELLRRVGAAVDKPARLLPVPPKLLEFGASLLGKKAVAQRLLGSLQVDISHTCSTLGWKPPVTVDEALAKTAAFYLEEHGAS